MGKSPSLGSSRAMGAPAVSSSSAAASVIVMPGLSMGLAAAFGAVMFMAMAKAEIVLSTR